MSSTIESYYKYKLPILTKANARQWFSQAKTTLEAKDIEYVLTVTREVYAYVGLAYVGLPLAVEFGKKFETIGFDLSAVKIASYRRFCDPTGEISSEELRAASQLTPTS